MLRIVAVCGAGVGSSMMLRLFTQQILDAENIEAEVEAADVSSLNADAYDFIITTTDFADVIGEKKTPIIKIDNMMDKEYLKKELMNAIKSRSDSE